MHTLTVVPSAGTEYKTMYQHSPQPARSPGKRRVFPPPTFPVERHKHLRYQALILWRFQSDVYLKTYHVTSNSFTSAFEA